jgi:hypothetical protein
MSPARRAARKLSTNVNDVSGGGHLDPGVNVCWPTRSSANSPTGRCTRVVVFRSTVPHADLGRGSSATGARRISMLLQRGSTAPGPRTATCWAQKPHPVSGGPSATVPYGVKPPLLPSAASSARPFRRVQVKFSLQSRRMSAAHAARRVEIAARGQQRRDREGAVGSDPVDRGRTSPNGSSASSVAGMECWRKIRFDACDSKSQPTAKQGICQGATT